MTKNGLHIYRQLCAKAIELIWERYQYKDPQGKIDSLFHRESHTSIFQTECQREMEKSDIFVYGNLKSHDGKNFRLTR